MGGRDAASVLLTVGVGMVLVENERDAKAVLETIPAQRRAMITTATVSQAGETLEKYLDAGFRGFTMSNQTLPRTESIARAGELIKLLRSTRTAA